MLCNFPHRRYKFQRLTVGKTFKADCSADLNAHQNLHNLCYLQELFGEINFIGVLKILKYFLHMPLIKN